MKSVELIKSGKIEKENGEHHRTHRRKAITMTIMTTQIGKEKDLEGKERRQEEKHGSGS